MCNKHNIQIEEYIKQHLVSRRNNIRTLLKTDKYNLSNMTSFIKQFLLKLEYINNILRKEDPTLIQDNLKLLATFIISDSIILIFIEDLINSLDRNEMTSIMNFINTIKIFNKYDNGEIYRKVLTNFGNSFTKQFLNMEQVPLPVNIKSIQDLCSVIKYVSSIEEYYKFLNSDIGIINMGNYELLISKLINVFKTNNPFEIKYTLSNIKHIISKINKSIFNTEKISNTLVTEVINIIMKYEKSGEYIFDIIDIIDFIDSILIQDKLSQSTKINRNVITEKLASIICSDKILNMIHIKIDDYMQEGKISNVMQILTYCINVKDKDLFINKYYEYCKSRMMHYISMNANFEKIIKDEYSILTYLGQKYSDKNVYKIKKIIDDAKSSYDNMLNFNILLKTNMTVLTTSYKNWDINQSEGVITTTILQNMGNSIMGKALRNYKKFYETRYEEKRSLYYSLHFGEVDITFMGQQLVMLPIQFCVLELYENTDTIDFTYLKSSPFFLNYSDKFRSDTIYSLIAGGLLRKSGNNITLATSGQFKQNLIDIFFTNSDYTMIWQENKNQELAHSREEIIMANINHIVKTNNSHNLSCKELYKCVQDNIKLFDMTQDMFDKAIDYMVLHQYITTNNDNVIKLVW